MINILSHTSPKSNQEKLKSYLAFLTSIPIFYIAFGIIWITVTDSITFNFNALKNFQQEISQGKGLLFILVTFLLFYKVLNKVARRITYLNIELEKLSLFDQLTGTYNRHYAFDKITSLLNYSSRNKISFGLLFLDINNFKQINDTHGHCFGDRILKGVAERIVSTLRKTDTVTRYGGDEFLIILQDITKEDLEKIQIKITSAFDQYFPANNGQPIHITASIGAAIFPINGETLEDLIHHADKDMYLQKRTNYTFFKPKRNI